MQDNWYAGGIAFLITLLAYMLKSLLTRLEEGNKSLHVMDKNLAVLLHKIDNFSSRVTVLEIELQDLKEKIMQIEIKLEDR